MAISGDEFHGKRVAFVATRVAGTDGVSQEIEKWAAVLERLGIECFYIAGECDRPAERTALVEKAHFRHPEILEITQHAFEQSTRPAQATDDILESARTIRNELNRALADFGVDAIIAQNSLTIPMNIPLGIALVHIIQEQGLGCVAHHHDFYWERQRYLINGVDDFLRYAFPPSLPQIQHVVINSVAAEEFSRRTGLSCRIIPNVMDFSSPPDPPDEYARKFRTQIGLDEDELLILQPTRIVARKGIEHSVELVRRLPGLRAKLVITHAAGDEGESYYNFLHLFSDLIKVNVVFAEQWLADHRGTAENGELQFTLDDVYRVADLVTYPSDYEGFGNAFLEAIYYRRPILCKRYPIFRKDIEPCGFQLIAFDEFLTRETVEEVVSLLRDERAGAEMTEHNYNVARRNFSYEVLEEELRPILRRAFLQKSCR